MLGRYSGKGRSKYDCLVPFSGGKDSTYTLWLLKNKYGMNPLAFNVDNGFAEEGAQQFIRECTGKLGVDLYTYSPSKEFIKRVYSHAMHRTGEFCTACVVLIPTAIFRAADIHGIRLIAGGFCEATEAPPPEYANMVRAGFLSRREAMDLLEEREAGHPPEGFFDFMDSIGCKHSILEETEGRSTFDFPARRNRIRKTAIRIREMLP
ncbi:MAG: hypothetical protein KAR44_09990 [Candidatus Aegiribacteria sp.]|nr:hypothetical protein [Candidatus Aegiribacteria sp.]